MTPDEFRKYYDKIDCCKPELYRKCSIFDTEETTYKKNLAYQQKCENTTTPSYFSFFKKKYIIIIFFILCYINTILLDYTRGLYITKKIYLFLPIF